MLRFGYEIGYADNITKPIDPSDPDNSSRIILNKFEKLYIRMFGFPDITKQLQAYEIFSILNMFTFKNVLDIGCAQGHYSISIARKYPNCKVTGIDIRQEELIVGEEVKKKLEIKNLLFKKENIYEISKNEKYELVLLLQVIEHLEDDIKVLNKISEILSKKGIVIITGPISNLPKWFKSGRKKNIDSHYREGYNLVELTDTISGMGLKILQTKYLSGYFGELIEKIATFLELKSIYLYALIYPILCILLIIEKKIKKQIGSGFLIIGMKT